MTPLLQNHLRKSGLSSLPAVQFIALFRQAKDTHSNPIPDYTSIDNQQLVKTEFRLFFAQDEANDVPYLTR